MIWERRIVRAWCFEMVTRVLKIHHGGAVYPSYGSYRFTKKSNIPTWLVLFLKIHHGGTEARRFFLFVLGKISVVKKQVYFAQILVEYVNS
jgi:hypothetical protein